MSKKRRDAKRAAQQKQNNQYVLDKYYKGDSLATIPASATFFPPGHKIEKDKEAIAKLYGNPEEEQPKRKLALVKDEEEVDPDSETK